MAGLSAEVRLAVGSAEGAVETAAATSESYNNEHTHMLKYIIIQHTPVDVKVSVLILYDTFVKCN